MVVGQLHERGTLHLAWRRHNQFCGTRGHAEGTILPPIVNLPLLMRSHASSQKEVNLFAPAKELGRNGLSQVLVRRAPLTGSDPLGRATIPLAHFPTCQELQERRTCTARISKWSCLNFPEGRTSSLTGRQGKSKAEPSTQTKLSWILLPGEPPETLSARNILTYQTFKRFCISFDDCKWPWTSDGTWILSRIGRIRKAQQNPLSGKFWPPQLWFLFLLIWLDVRTASAKSSATLPPCKTFLTRAILLTWTSASFREHYWGQDGRGR